MTIKNQVASDNCAGICHAAWQVLQEAKNAYTTSDADIDSPADDIREIMG